MADEQIEAPESTAVRVALWRAMHVEVDAPPHVLDDQVGLQLVAPDDGWRARPLADRYFADRTDHLRPSTGEDFVLATTGSEVHQRRQDSNAQ